MCGVALARHFNFRLIIHSHLPVLDINEDCTGPPAIVLHVPGHFLGVVQDITPRPEDFLNRRFQKLFLPDGHTSRRKRMVPFIGTILSYNPHTKHFHALYEDRDRESFDMEEVQTLAFLDPPATQPSLIHSATTPTDSSHTAHTQTLQKAPTQRQHRTITARKRYLTITSDSDSDSDSDTDTHIHTSTDTDTHAHLHTGLSTHTDTHTYTSTDTYTDPLTDTPTDTPHNTSLQTWTQQPKTSKPLKTPSCRRPYLTIVDSDSDRDLTGTSGIRRITTSRSPSPSSPPRKRHTSRSIRKRRRSRSLSPVHVSHHTCTALHATPVSPSQKRHRDTFFTANDSSVTTALTLAHPAPLHTPDTSSLVRGTQPP